MAVIGSGIPKHMTQKVFHPPKPRKYLSPQSFLLGLATSKRSELDEAGTNIKTELSTNLTEEGIETSHGWQLNWKIGCLEGLAMM